MANKIKHLNINGTTYDTSPTKTSELTNDSGFLRPGENWGKLKDSSGVEHDITPEFKNNTDKYESYLSWGGGRNYSGTFGPMDAALVSKLGANRVAGINGEAITIERSNDSGSTWSTVSTSTYSNNNRKALFTTSAYIKLRYGDKNAVTDRLRITMNATDYSVYTQIYKIMMYVSTSGSGGCKVLIETAYYSSPTIWHTVGTYDITGWSGWNVINLHLPGSGSLGGSNSDFHNKFIRFTFSCTSVHTTYTDGLGIYSIYMYGGVGWNTPSTLAANGVPYSYDENGNVTFSGIINAGSYITASNFYENGTALSSKYLGISEKAADADKLNGHPATYYLVEIDDITEEDL